MSDLEITLSLLYCLYLGLWTVAVMSVLELIPLSLYCLNLWTVAVMSVLEMTMSSISCVYLVSGL